MSLAYLFDSNIQFQDRSGNNNVNGFLRVYIDDTDDRAVTYKDFNGTLNQADIRLDNNGRAVVIVDDSKTYRLEVYGTTGVRLWTLYPISPKATGINETLEALVAAVKSHTIAIEGLALGKKNKQQAKVISGIPTKTVKSISQNADGEFTVEFEDIAFPHKVLVDGEDSVPKHLEDAIMTDEQGQLKLYVDEKEDSTLESPNKVLVIDDSVLRERIDNNAQRIENLEETIDEMDWDSVPRAYLASTLNQSPGDSVTTRTTIDVFSVTAIEGECFEFEQTTTIDDTPFGYVWIEPGTYLINAAVTLQWVGNPRGTFIAKVGSVMGENFDFSQEQEISRQSTKVVTIPNRMKLAVNVTYDAGTPVMGFWIQSMQVVKLAGGMSQTNIIHDDTLAGQGSVSDPLGVDEEKVAQSTLAGNLAPEYDSVTGAVAGNLYVNDGKTYLCKTDTNGDFDSSKFKNLPFTEIFQKIAYNYIFAGNTSNPDDLDDIKDNVVYLVQRTTATATSNFPSDFPTDSNISLLTVVKSHYNVAAYIVTQTIEDLVTGKKWFRRFTTSSNSWNAWSSIDAISDIVSLRDTTPVIKRDYIFAGNATNPTDLDILKDNAIYLVQRTSATITANFPSDYPSSGEQGILSVVKSFYSSTAYLVQQRLVITSQNKSWFRYYSESLGTWTAWEKTLDLNESFANVTEVKHDYIFAGNTSNPDDLDDIKDNIDYLVQRTTATATSNFPSDFPTDSRQAFLRVRKSYYNVSGYLVQQQLTDLTTGDFWFRRFTSSTNTWNAWNYVQIPKKEIITIGQGKMYTTLRAGIAEAIKTKNNLVYVYPGTYDLKVEFADVIPSIVDGDNSSGIQLNNGVHVKFFDGAKVLANFTSADGYTDAQLAKLAIKFQPFYAKVGDFILENLDIEATNTRYCVHDENSGLGEYFRYYLGCKMVYHNTLQNAYARFHAIGGGLGEHGTIVIDGGCYKVDPGGYGNPQVGDTTGDNSQMCILYHNGNNVNCDSTITIKNVYFEERGYIKIGWYGSSTIMSSVFVDSCSFGLPLLHIGQRYDAMADNFDVKQWNNEQRVIGVHWEINPNGYEATLEQDV